jgi:hypothetical protein
VEPCRACGKTGVETRDCFIDGLGLTALCQNCAYFEAKTSRQGLYDFSSWIAQDCDDCCVPTAFKGRLLGYPDGVRCDECKNPTGGPAWICVFCLVQKHNGHKFTSWGPSELDIIFQQIQGYI